MLVTIILLVLIGLFSAILGSLVGIGGGIIIVPTLVYLGVTRCFTWYYTTNSDRNIIGDSNRHRLIFILRLLKDEAGRY